MSDSLKRVAVIGAGPAGLSAALWLKQLGLSPVLFEREARPGGMLRFNFLENEWVLGLQGLTGVEIGERFVAHVAYHEVPIYCAQQITRLIPTPSGWRLHFAGDSTPFSAQAVVVATGLRYRGSESLTGVRGVATLADEQIAYGPFAFVDLARWRGAAVLIIGCGDNAFENALRLTALDAEVFLLCRSQPRAQAHFQAALAGKVTVVEQGQLLEVHRLNGRFLARWLHPHGTDQRSFDRLHILTGYAPNSEWLIEALGEAQSGVRQTADGYVVVDEWCRTNLPFLYAAGDLVNRDFPSVVSAVAAGAKAAKAIEQDLRSFT